MMKFLPNLIKKAVFSNSGGMSQDRGNHLYIVFMIVVIVILMRMFDKDGNSSCTSSSSSSSTYCSSDDYCSTCDSSSSYCDCPTITTSSYSSSEPSSCTSSSSSSESSYHPPPHPPCPPCPPPCPPCPPPCPPPPCKPCVETKDCGDPYDGACKKEVVCSYNRFCSNERCYLEITVNSHQLCIPQYILRTVPHVINFFYTFYICNLSNTQINSMIMLKDLLQWMTQGVALTSDILPDNVYPILFITKDPCGKVQIYEYLKVFVTTDDSGVRNAFVTKGTDYLCIYDKINKLLVGCNDCPLIYDLLNGNEYYTYNISETSPLSLLQFLIAFLSLYLIPECLIGKEILFDVSYCNETKLQLEYFYEFFNCDCNMSTTIC